MKLKRIVATDMRQAIRKVRDELGADAIIISNQKVDDGVEILAAQDYDEASYKEHLAAIKAQSTEQAAVEPYQAAEEISKVVVVKPRVAAEAPQGVAEAPKAFAEPIVTDVEVAKGALDKPALKETSSITTEMPLEKEMPSRQFVEEINIQQKNVLNGMREELTQMRNVMESQLDIVGWGRWSRRSPLRASILKRLTQAGFGSALSREIVSQLTGVDDTQKVWRNALEILVKKIKVTNDDILSNGGVIALVGATGVGKTTTIAKLAARFAMRHGTGNIALVSADTFRIGALDQLMTYGRILGVPVYNVSDKEELREILKGTKNKQLVLIDTAGLSLRDTRLVEQLATLKDESLAIRNYLVLSATTQLDGSKSIVDTFSCLSLKGYIVTKVDEARSLGGVLTISAQYGLPLAYVANGQRVPEDFELARTNRLISKTFSLANESESIDTESMAFTFGRMVANAHA